MTTKNSFTVTLYLGNDAMHCAWDVAEALRAVADKLERMGFNPGHTQCVLDDNGKMLAIISAYDPVKLL